MAFVITMGGLSKRFSEAGYNTPKYALPLGNKTLFEFAVLSFKNYFKTDLFIFVVKSDGFAPEFVKKKIANLGIKSYDIVELQEDTSGQAESLFIGLEDYRDDFPIYVFNIDTIRHNFKKPSIASSCDGFLEIFRGSGSNWSFVEPGDNYSVIRTTEKDPISNLCSNGLYFFRSHIQFQDAFRSLNKTDMVKGEFYIAPIYNSLINNGADIRYVEVTSDCIDFCGTPSEYLNLMEDF